jgi:hypothetical protein
MTDRFKVSGRRVARLVVPAVAGLVLALAAVPGFAQRGEIDFNRARLLRDRDLRGESLTPDERAYLERPRAAFQKKQAGAMKGPQRPARDTTGLTPLTDLAGAARYQEQDGGLYGGGKNEPPAAQRAAALRAAGQVTPLDARGRPAPDGKVVLISVGMSNTTQEFQRFKTLARRDAALAHALVLVDGAQGGMEASAWAQPEKAIAAGRPDPWTVLGQRLAQAGVSPRQVQVAWIKQARANPAALGEFPGHAEVLRDNLAVIARKLHNRFPGLKIAYLSSRTYAGHAATPLNPEPYAYESAFSVRWLIRDQVEGKPGLNADPGKGRVEAPVLLWGPYLWADGLKGRATDGLVWKRADLAADGTHPGPGGQQKVAELLLQFFKTDPTAKPWFLEHTAAPPGR